MLDSDLATLYGVETKALTRAVIRNIERFPDDFMFQLDEREFENLRYQIGTSSLNHGGRRHSPRVFTQEGVAMLSGVLRSPQAVKANVAIMRAFVQLRSLLGNNLELSKKIEDLETKYDRSFKAVFDAIKNLMSAQTSNDRKRIKGLTSTT